MSRFPAASHGGGRTVTVRPPHEPRAPPPNTAAVAAAEDAAVRSPALQKLKQLKAKLTEELEEVENERQEAEHSEREERIIPLSLEDEFRIRRHAKGKSGMQEKQKSAEPSRRKQERDHLQWVEEQERIHQEDKLRGQRLRSIIELRQDSSKRREGRCEEQIATLKRRLDATMVKNYDHKEMMAKLRELNSQIQSRVDQLQGDIDSHAEVEKMNIVRQCRVRMHELKKELKEEEEHTGATNREWIEKNEVLEVELREANSTLDLVQASNEKLARNNKELKVCFKQQEEERQTLVKQITQVKKENQRLDEQRQCLEEEAIRLAQHQRDTVAERRSSTAPAPGTISAGVSLPPAGRPGLDQEVRYNELIRQFKRKIEQERKTLQQVRTAHIDLLRERTELELFLRQCVDDVRREIARNTIASGSGLSGGTSAQGEPRHDTALSDYSVQDRKRLLELLLSKERVLNLLYSKTFPFKLPQATLSDELEMELDPDGNPAVQTASAELDMDSLWAKWKAWTEAGP